jgi:hypothetical protein
MTTNQAKLNVLNGARNALRAWRQNGPIGTEMATLVQYLAGYDQAAQDTGAAPKLSAAESSVLNSARDAAVAWQASSSCSSTQIDALEKSCEAYAAETAPKGTEDLEAAIATLQGQVRDLTSKLEALSKPS